MITDDDFIRKVYENLKQEFSEFVQRGNWIWVDYFANEDGYKYFHDTYLNDVENITKQLGQHNSSEHDDIKDISSYIGEIWKTCEFCNSIIQSSQYC